MLGKKDFSNKIWGQSNEKTSWTANRRRKCWKIFEFDEAEKQNQDCCWDACGEFHNGIPTIEICEIDSAILKRIYRRKPDVKLENTYSAIFHIGCHDSKAFILEHAKKLKEIQIDAVLSE